MSKLRLRSYERVALFAVVGLAAALLVLGADSRAETTGSQFHFRTGMVSGNFGGAVSGSFSVTNSMDFDYEIFSATKRSWVLRSIMAYDLTEARLMYAYTGVGRRFYIKSNGMMFDDAQGGNRVSAVPKMRYYLGFDAGISQVVVKTFGTVLQASSALLDLGGHAGLIYQVSKAVGVDAQFGYTIGQGFSSVTVGAKTMRVLLGVSYFF